MDDHVAAVERGELNAAERALWRAERAAFPPAQVKRYARRRAIHGVRLVCVYVFVCICTCACVCSVCVCVCM
jgi:hypothetical protein